MSNYNTRSVPGHDGYFFNANGWISYIDRRLMKEMVAPMFVGDGKIGEEEDIYVLLHDNPGMRSLNGDKPDYRAYLLASLVAESLGGSKNLRPIFRDQDKTNLNPKNIMPMENPPPVKPRRGRPPKKVVTEEVTSE